MCAPDSWYHTRKKIKNKNSESNFFFGQNPRPLPRPPPRPLPPPLPLPPPRPPRPRSVSFLALFFGFGWSSTSRVSRGRLSGRMKYRIVDPRILIVSNGRGSRPLGVILTVRNAVFICGDTEAIVPCRMVPFLSSIVTVSLMHFIRNLTSFILSTAVFHSSLEKVLGRNEAE